jgi:sialic acid synthase SpsE
VLKLPAVALLERHKCETFLGRLDPYFRDLRKVTADLVGVLRGRPAELMTMVATIRDIESALGTGHKLPMPSELPNVLAARRSVVARHAIRRGELLSDANLTIKRPGGGTSPMSYWSLLGRVAPRDYAADEVLDL